MRKLIAVIAFLLAVPAGANYFSTTCTQQNADDGFCPQSEVGNAWILFGYGLSPPNAIRLRDALAGLYQWPPTVECTQALVDNGDCIVDDLGEQVPNPEGQNDFADRVLKQIIKNFVRQWETNVAIDAEKQNQEGLPDVPVDDETP
jgi:hypothetical protein